jgi:parallel beta-helix repeat protein
MHASAPRSALVLPAGIAALMLGTTARAENDLLIDRDNTVVTQSVRIRPGEYRIKDADENGVLRITGDNVLVDFQGATLAAMPVVGADLSQAQGVGVVIEGAKNVTIRNAKVHGYFFNIRAVKAPGLKLEGCDVSYGRGHRIAVAGHPIEIWLVLRSLEAWRSYGAGIWIEESSDSVVRRCRGSGAQNGLLLVGSDECGLTENDFSFNSGFGIGLWASSRNVVAWNRIDFVNRPWGGGWGGDSAALVIANGSHENYLVGNSMTHSGDGLFLTDRVNGGFDEQKQTTRFEGSCNRNVIACNDGSWSTANAYEGTFSFGNVYYRNLANDSNFGFWLGYSSDSLIFENEVLRNNDDGIAIEHGHGTRIEANTFGNNRGAAIALWSSEGWLDRLHPSRDLEIRDNIIQHCGRAFRLDYSTQVSAGGNKIEGTPQSEFPFVERPPSSALAKFKQGVPYKRLQEILSARPRDFKMLRDEAGPTGVDWLEPDDFAPRDYRGGLVAWRRQDAATIELLPLVPDKLKFTAPDWVSIEPEGTSKLYTASARPVPGTGESKPYSIEISRAGAEGTQKLTGTFLTAQWDVRWYRWDQPVKLAYDDAAAWAKLFESGPIRQQTVRNLSASLWTRGFPENVPHSHFAILASTRVKLAGGRYKLSTLSDDGIRVFLDGREVISRWNNHGPTPDETEVDISEGLHEWVVHYCQEGGASALAFTWRRIVKP